MALNNPTSFYVPDADSTDNEFTPDVIGNKSDTTSGNSLVALVKQVLDAISSIDGEDASTIEGVASSLDTNGGTATSGLSGADVVTISVPSGEMRKVYSLLLNIENFTTGALVSIRLFTEINGTEKNVYTERFKKDRVPDGAWVINGLTVISTDLRVEIYSNKSADSSVDVDYEYIIEELK